VLGPVFAKAGPDTDGKYQFIGGDEHIGICDSRFAELLCYSRLERPTKNTKTGHRFVNAEDKLVFNYVVRKVGVKWRCITPATPTTCRSNQSP
jgi:hypothetical protein